MSRRTRMIHAALQGATYAAAYVGTTIAIGYVLVRHAILKCREAVEELSCEDEAEGVRVYFVTEEPTPGTVDDGMRWN